MSRFTNRTAVQMQRVINPSNLFAIVKGNNLPTISILVFFLIKPQSVSTENIPKARARNAIIRDNINRHDIEEYALNFETMSIEDL